MTNVHNLIRDALYTPISEVYYSDHVMDNTFVRSRLYETEWELEDRSYIPIGYCQHPEYSPCSGIAFVVKDDNDCIIWVHVPKSVFKSWIKQLGEDWKEHSIWKSENICEKDYEEDFEKKYKESEVDKGV